MTDDHQEFRDALAALRGDFREAVARIEGSISTLAATKGGEVDTLTREVSDLRHDHKTTKVSVSVLHDRLDEFPRPNHLQQTLDRLLSKMEDVATSEELQALETKLDEYPAAEDVKKGIERSHANQLSIVKLAAVAAGGGIVAQILETVGLF